MVPLAAGHRHGRLQCLPMADYWIACLKVAHWCTHECNRRFKPYHRCSRSNNRPLPRYPRRTTTPAEARAADTLGAAIARLIATGLMPHLPASSDAEPSHRWSSPSTRSTFFATNGVDPLCTGSGVMVGGLRVMPHSRTVAGVPVPLRGQPSLLHPCSSTATIPYT